MHYMVTGFMGTVHPLFPRPSVMVETGLIFLGHLCNQQI